MSAANTLCMLGNFLCFYCCLLFSKYFFLNYFKNTIGVSNGLDPDQDRNSVGPDLGPNHLQRLSVDDKGRHQHGKSLTVQKVKTIACHDSVHTGKFE